MQQVFYPDITNPVLLEIRRERAIGLVAEGTGYNDLHRWEYGELIEEPPWAGMHISALNAEIGLNGDGTPDCYFTDNGTQSSNKDCKTVNVKNETGLYATVNAAGGYDLKYNPGTGNRICHDGDRQYLYPVPAQVVRDYESAGYKLSRHPNWN